MLLPAKTAALMEGKVRYLAGWRQQEPFFFSKMEDEPLLIPIFGVLLMIHLLVVTTQLSWALHRTSLNSSNRSVCLHCTDFGTTPVGSLVSGDSGYDYWQPLLWTSLLFSVNQQLYERCPKEHRISPLPCKWAHKERMTGRDTQPGLARRKYILGKDGWQNKSKDYNF